MENNKRLIYAEDALVGLQYISMFGDVNDNMIQGAMRLARSKIENAKTVNAVEVEDQELLKAIKLFIAQYEHSKTSEYVHNPIAHALYHAWKHFDARR